MRLIAYGSWCLLLLVLRGDRYSTQHYYAAASQVPSAAPSSSTPSSSSPSTSSPSSSWPSSTAPSSSSPSSSWPSSIAPSSSSPSSSWPSSAAPSSSSPSSSSPSSSAPSSSSPSSSSPSSSWPSSNAPSSSSPSSSRPSSTAPSSSSPSSSWPSSAAPSSSSPSSSSPSSSWPSSTAPSSSWPSSSSPSSTVPSSSSPSSSPSSTAPSSSSPSSSSPSSTVPSSSWPSSSRPSSTSPSSSSPSSSTPSSSVPSSIPTSNPTEICQAGQERQSFYPYSCVGCQIGTYNDAPETFGKAQNLCQPCPEGAFAATTNSTFCTPCPLNMYNPSIGAGMCLSCPPGRATPFSGAANLVDCVDPMPNFIMAYVGLVVALGVVTAYVLRGRFHRIAFMREQRGVKVLKDMAVECEKWLYSIIDSSKRQNDYYRKEWFSGIVYRVHRDGSVDVKLDDRKSTRELETEIAIKTGSAVILKPYQKVLRILYCYIRKLIPKTMYNLLFGGYIEYYVHGDDVHISTSLFKRKSVVASPLSKLASSDAGTSISSSQEEDSLFFFHGDVDILSDMKFDSLSQFGDDGSYVERAYCALDGNMFLYKIYSENDIHDLERRLATILQKELIVDSPDIDVEVALLEKITSLVEYNLRNHTESNAILADSFISKILLKLKSADVQVLETIDEENIDQVASRRTKVVFEVKSYLKHNLRQVVEEFMVAVVRDLIDDFDVNTDNIKDHATFVQTLYVNAKQFSGDSIITDDLIRSECTKLVNKEILSYMEHDFRQVYNIQEDGNDRFYQITGNFLVLHGLKVNGEEKVDLKKISAVDSLDFAKSSPNLREQDIEKNKQNTKVILNITDSYGKELILRVRADDQLRNILQAVETVKYLKPLARNDVVKCRVRCTRFASNLRILLLWVSGFVLVLMCFLVFIAVSFTQVLFSSLIVVRSIPEVKFVRLLSDLEEILVDILQIPYIGYVLYPFVNFFYVLSLINIDFSQIAVTCAGSQSPLQLTLICLILLTVVLVIESKLSIFLKVFLRCVNSRYFLTALQFKFSLPLTSSRADDLIEQQTNDIRSKTDDSQSEDGLSKAIPSIALAGDCPPSKSESVTTFKKIGLLLLSGFAAVIGMTDPAQRIMQYTMGLAPINEFTQVHGVAHDSTEACDKLENVPNIDLSLAVLSSILFWSILFPALYTLSKVLVPYESDKKSFEEFYKFIVSMFTISKSDHETESSLDSNASFGKSVQLSESFSISASLAACDSTKDTKASSNDSAEPSISKYISDITSFASVKRSTVSGNQVPLSSSSDQTNYPKSKNLRVPRMSASYSEGEGENGDQSIVDSDSESDNAEDSRGFNVTIYKAISRFIKYTSYFALDLWILSFCSFCLTLLKRAVRMDIEKPLHSMFSIPFSERTEYEKKLWKTRCEEYFPPYRDLCREVYRDLLRRIRRVFGMNSLLIQKKKRLIFFNFLIEVVVFFASYTGIGHFLTITGRRKWIIVVRKYGIFLCVCIGIWTDEFFECYGLNKFIDPSDEYYVGAVYGVGVRPNSGKENIKLTVTYLLEGVVSIRAVLIQIYARITPLSLLAIGEFIFKSNYVNYNTLVQLKKRNAPKTINLFFLLLKALSGNPIFVFSNELRKYLPNLLETDALESAILLESFEQKESVAKSARDRRVFWKVYIASMIIFARNSRAIQCFYQVFLLVVSIGIIYGDIRRWILAAVVVLFPYLLIQSLEVVILVGKKFRISDDDIGLRNIEKNLYNFGYRCCYCCARKFFRAVWYYLKLFFYSCYHAGATYLCRGATVSTQNTTLSTSP